MELSYIQYDLPAKAGTPNFGACRFRGGAGSLLAKVGGAAALAILVCRGAAGQGGASEAALSAWLEAQTNMQTWSADFTQTRRLKALTQPLVASGHVWFAAPNRFRWQIDQPSQTIAVRQAQQLEVITPKLKHAEVYRLDGASAGPWKDTLALLDAGFPRSRAEVESRFKIVSQTETNGIHELTLQPKAERARRIMPRIKIAFEVKSLALRSTELELADGSTMENVFANATMNPKIEEAVFNPSTEGYKVTEPFKK